MKPQGELKQSKDWRSGTKESYRPRLLVLLFTLTFIAVSAGSLVFVLNRIVNAKTREIVVSLDNELSALSRRIYEDLSNLSLRSASLARQVSESIEASLTEADIAFADLSLRPGLLESILNAEFGTLLKSLQESKSSGAFIVLDATINPYIPGAEYSRSGLYLKNMEASAVHPAYYDIRYLRGPASIARKNLLQLLPQWEMEFWVKDADYFWTPMDKTAGTDLPLSRQYYWSPKYRLGKGESAMLCAVPLVAGDGTIMGVSGFEIDSMLFKSQYSPHRFRGVPLTCVLAPTKPEGLVMNAAMIAGTYSPDEAAPAAVMKCSTLKSGLTRYSWPGGSYLGVHARISIYPEDSAYRQEEWSVAVLIPEEELSGLLIAETRPVAQLLVLFTGACVALAVRRSRGHTKQVQETTDRESEEHLEKSGQLPPSGTAMLEQFAEKLGTLSRAETAVFELYAKGHGAKEIADILFLSINTIKTHTKRIYAKLGVSSRRELLLYARMMEDSKKEGEISMGQPSP